MGGSYSAPPPESTAAMLGAYQQYLPQLLQELAAGTPGVAQGTLNATEATQPGYNALNLSQLQKYALPEAQVGQQVAQSNALAGAGTNLAQLNGPGGAAATSATNLLNNLSPAYAASQKGAAEGVNAINLTGLSPGEEAATERSLNQTNYGTGNLGLLNPNNTIANAVNFGGAFNSKLGLLNNATNTATSAASAGGFSPVNVALGQPQPSTMGNFGTSMFGSPVSSNTQAGSTGNAFNFGSGLLGNVNSSNNALISAGTQNSIANSPVSYLGSVCCFIFLEAYKGKIPWYVRFGRDRYYKLQPNIATGYRRVAKWLVPLMQSNRLVRATVWHLMVNPVTHHLGRICGKPSRSFPVYFNKVITHFWLHLWAFLGKGHKESEYAMEWRYVWA